VSSSPNTSLQFALVFLVPELEPLVGPWRARYDPSASQGAPAHVSLLVPFKPAQLVTEEVVADLTSFFGEWHLQPLEFAGVCAFRNAIYLPPEPQVAVSELIQRLAERYPDAPPYAGAIALSEIVPHVTVAYSDGAKDLLPISDAFCRASIGYLPVRAQIKEALLLVQDQGRAYRTRAVLPFKT
jgi:2'-5' RNA ligase